MHVTACRPGSGLEFGSRFRTVGGRRGCVRLRTRGGGAPPAHRRLRTRAGAAGGDSGDKRGAAGGGAGGLRDRASRTGLTRRLGASRAIAPRERETRDIVGSSTKYAVRRFDNRHIHDKQTSRIMMRIESIEA